MRRDQYPKSILYVSLGIGTLVLIIPWAMRRYGIELFAVDPGVAGRIAGVVAVAVGATMYFSCALDFSIRGQGTPAFWDPPRRLVVNPWFRVTRNPMYVGVFFMILGQALWFGSAAILAYAVAVTLAFHVFVVAYEEPHLARRYGERYREYTRRVPRWIPRIPALSAAVASQRRGPRDSRS
jgi:protein-S-isoprenylcysteine O-methyltransferase Ste14